MNPEIADYVVEHLPPKLIATILKAPREQLKESDQPHSVEEIAGPIPEIPLEYDQILEGGTVGICPKILCWLRDVKKLIGYFLKVSTRLYETVGLYFGWTQTSLWIRHERKFDRGCVKESTKRRSKVRFNELYQLLNCSLQCHLSKL